MITSVINMIVTHWNEIYIMKHQMNITNQLYFVEVNEYEEENRVSQENKSVAYYT